MGGVMNLVEQLIPEIESRFDEVIAGRTEEGKDLWKKFTSQHPADIALVLDHLSEEHALAFFERLDKKFTALIFDKLSTDAQAVLISHFDDEELVYIFKQIPSDRLTMIFEQIPAKSLGKYLKLTNKKRSKRIASSLESEDKSAGRVLNSDVLTLHKELTVKKIISLLHDLSDNYEILPRQYVVDNDMKLTGYIEITDLLRNCPTTRIEKIAKKIDVKACVDDDQEMVAEVVRRYDLLSIPVTDKKGHFLGVIAANDVLEIIEEEMTEDTYKMSGLSPVEHSYVKTSFFKIVLQRSRWLAPLLLFQSVSGFVVHHFEAIIMPFGLIPFLMMLVGTGGNVGNQSATLVVRGLATGEINRKNKLYVLLREILISIFIGMILIVVAGVRVYFVNQHLPTVATICLSLFSIVTVSVSLGTIIPIILDYWEIDPAHSAAPFISTLMDVIGVTIYCLIANFILG
jgi:magnesium transporter